MARRYGRAQMLEAPSGGPSVEMTVVLPDGGNGDAPACGPATALPRDVRPAKRPCIDPATACLVT